MYLNIAQYDITLFFCLIFTSQIALYVCQVLHVPNFYEYMDMTISIKHNFKFFVAINYYEFIFAAQTA